MQSALLVLLSMHLLFTSAYLRAEVIGYAYPQSSPDAAALLYTESHRYNDRQHKVVYSTPQQQEFARKTISYTRSFSTPDIDFSNDYCQERYQLKHNAPVLGEELTPSILTIDYYNGCDDKSLQRSLTMTDPYVVDAGFDHFIRDHLPDIRSNKLLFSYPLPSRGSDVVLTAVSESCRVIAKKFSAHLKSIPVIANAQLHWYDCVRVQPKNWILAQFFPPIYLVYSESKELQLYAGKSNVADSEGRYRKVVIFYRSYSERFAKNMLFQ